MQQKQIKYLLLLGVALIWGTVLYRLLSSINDNPNSRQTISKKSVFKDNDSSSYQSYTLLINYYDPFGADEDDPGAENTTAGSIRETSGSLETNVGKNLKPDIGFIKYKGIITNSITHKKAAIISINGKDELARMNKVVNNITINSIKKDKIQVTYLGKKYWIKRQ